jgi:hypothetical protein
MFQFNNYKYFFLFPETIVGYDDAVDRLEEGLHGSGGSDFGDGSRSGQYLLDISFQPL